MTGFLGTYCTKKEGEGEGKGVSEEKKWLTSKNEGLGGLFRVVGWVEVWASPTSLIFIVELS